MKDLYLISLNEPCFMCAMALVHSRISRLYWITRGDVETSKDLVADGGLLSNGVSIGYLKNLNHQYL